MLSSRSGTAIESPIRRVGLALSGLVVAGALVGCGAGQADDAARTTDERPPAAAEGLSDSSQTTAPPDPVSTSAAPARPSYKILDRAALTDALLTVDQLPPGYSQDPPFDGEGNKNFCDYEAPVEEKVRIRRDFTKGGGMSTELVTLTLRQFESADHASAAWEAMAKALETCTGEVYEGTKLVYTPMSAPDVGDESIGVKIDADGMTLLQNFVLVGPTMISGGGGGLMNADADAIAGLLERQVERYEAAAGD